jgi:hypothetical protein
MSESKDDDPITASRGDHAQSECHCALYSNSVTYPLQKSYLIVSLFQENKSFGASTICIHPLMYGKPCREQVSVTYSYFCLCSTRLFSVLSEPRVPSPSGHQDQEGRIPWLQRFLLRLLVS